MRRPDPRPSLGKGSEEGGGEQRAQHPQGSSGCGGWLPRKPSLGGQRPRESAGSETAGTGLTGWGSARQMSVLLHKVRAKGW